MKLIKFLAKIGIVLALLALFGVLSVVSDVFLTPTNLWNLVRQISVMGLLAIGMTFVIIGNGIDLSVGSVLAFAGCTAAVVAEANPLGGIFFPITVGLLTGLAFGSLNGVIIALGKIPPFIVTLGVMTAARGMVLIYSRGHPINIISNEQFLSIGGGYLGFVPIPVMIFSLVGAASYFILSQTLFGVDVYAVGGNEEAARVCGIRTRLIKGITYVISGLLAGAGGIVLAARVHSARPIAGVGYELDAIAAVVIGGTSFTGGRGGIIGTMIGLMLIGVLANGLNLLNVPSYYQDVAKGFIVISAVLVDRWRRERE